MRRSLNARDNLTKVSADWLSAPGGRWRTRDVTSTSTGGADFLSCLRRHLQAEEHPRVKRFEAAGISPLYRDIFDDEDCADGGVRTGLRPSDGRSARRGPGRAQAACRGCAPAASPGAGRAPAACRGRAPAACNRRVLVACRKPSPTTSAAAHQR